MDFKTQRGIDISQAIFWLNANEIVGIPTETVYGLAGNGLNEQAITRIFQAKNRPFFDPLILHFPNIAAIESCVLEFPEDAKKLAEHFWPGPLTLVLPKSDSVPFLLTSGSDSVAVRIPNHPLSLQLLEALPYPLAAPSANPFTYVSPTSAQHVMDQLAGKIPYVLDGGPSSVGIESTIVSFENAIPRVLRLGGISLEALRDILPSIAVQIQHAPNTSMAPGQMAHHYAPRCALYPIDSDEFRKDRSPKNLLKFQNQDPIAPEDTLFDLSPDGNMSEAAAQLFTVLRKFDEMQLKRVYFDWLPDRDLGRAINDRLSRAQKKSTD